MQILLLPILIGIFIMIVTVLLFGIVTVVAGVIGGTSVALLMKNKLCKQLLAIGFAIVALIGISFLAPLIAVYVNLPPAIVLIVTLLLYIGIAILAGLGMKLAQAINNNVGRVIVVVVFGIVLVIDVSLILLTSYFLFL